jgi:hypothetical protein
MAVVNSAMDAPNDPAIEIKDGRVIIGGGLMMGLS